MSGPAYRGFRIISGIFSALTAIAGLVVILSGKPLITTRALLRVDVGSPRGGDGGRDGTRPAVRQLPLIEQRCRESGY